MFVADLLAGKRVLVTGGGTGLGASMARRFAQLGARPILCGRRAEPLAETAAAIRAAHGVDVETHRLDIRDPDAVAAMMDAIFASAPLDVLVNNAAGNIAAKTETLSARAMSAVVDIVLKGSAHCSFDAGKRWLEAERPGTILSIVTSYAWTGSPFVVPSAMGKAGVLAMTRSLAVEWGGRGIRANAIAPGPFPTDGAWERLVPNPELAEAFEKQNPLGRVGRHEELTDLASFMISDQAGYMNGACIALDGGEWLMSGGQFGFLRGLDDAAWASMGGRGRKSPEKPTASPLAKRADDA